MTRFARQDTRNCVSCHTGGPGTPIHRPMYEGLDGRYNPPQATWEWVGRLKKLSKMKLFLKGLDSAEDAKLAVEHGADGIIVFIGAGCQRHCKHRKCEKKQACDHGCSLHQLDRSWLTHRKDAKLPNIV